MKRNRTRRTENRGAQQSSIPCAGSAKCFSQAGEEVMENILHFTIKRLCHIHKPSTRKSPRRRADLPMRLTWDPSLDDLTIRFYGEIRSATLGTPGPHPIAVWKTRCVKVVYQVIRFYVVMLLKSLPRTAATLSPYQSTSMSHSSQTLIWRTLSPFWDFVQRNVPTILYANRTTTSSFLLTTPALMPFWVTSYHVSISHFSQGRL